MKTMKNVIGLAALMLFPTVANAQLLKGKIVGADEESVSIMYLQNPLDVRGISKTVPVNNGLFTFDETLPEESGDATIYVGNESFEAHLTNGKTLEMTLTKKGDKYDATYKGSGSDVSRYMNGMEQSFRLMRYVATGKRERPTADSLYNVLNLEKMKCVKALKKIKDKNLRTRYGRLSEAKYTNIAHRLLNEMERKGGLDSKQKEEQLRIKNQTDINDEANIRSFLSIILLQEELKKDMAYKGDMGPYCREFMEVTREKVTNPILHRQTVDLIGQRYFAWGDDSGDYHAFFNEFKQFAGKDNQDYIKRYQDVVNSWDSTKSGAKAPNITLDLPDGSQVQLKDIAKGKFTYIDVWATWCGPCKKEIPFFAKLVEQFKGNDKVQFISISVDENVKAWKDMIAKEQPQWPQYNINGDTHKKFNADWGITGIPRFIMIDKNGNIFSADATRPSNEETAKTIEQQTK